MAQRPLVRGSIAVVAAFTMASGFACLAAPAAQAATVSETVVPAAYGYIPLADSVAFAGPGGFLHTPQGASGYVWTKFSGGPDTPVSGSGASGAGADVVSTVSGSTIQLQNMDTGEAATITVPAGQQYVGTYGSHVLTRAAYTGSAAQLEVLSIAGGQQTSTPVAGWPAGATFAAALSGDAASVVIRYNTSTDTGLAVVDLATGQLTAIPGSTFPLSTPSAVGAVLTGKYIAWYGLYSAHPELHVLNRSDLSPKSTIQVPWPSVPDLSSATVARLAIAGDTLLIEYNLSFTTAPTQEQETGGPLYAMPLTGGTPSLVLDHMGRDTLRTDANGALVVGGSSVRDWGARQLAVAADGSLTDTVVDAYPAPPSTVLDLSLAGGQLLTTEEDNGQQTSDYARTVQLGSPPTYGPHALFGSAGSGDCRTAGYCPLPLGTGDGRVTTLMTDSAGDFVTDTTPIGVDGMVNPGGTDGAGPAGPTGGTLVDADGRFSVYDNTSTGKQYIGDTTATFEYGSSVFTGAVLFTRPITGAALSGETLWAAGPAAGSLSAIDLTTQATTQTVDTGAPCVPSELQAAGGRWIYWSCGASGPAGVYDLATRTDIPVPSAGPAQLGDGYLVEHDMAAGKLELTDVHTGTAVTSDLAALPAGPHPDDRRLTWTVDKYGGGIAYVDAQQDIHLIDPHIPTSPAYGYRMLPGQRLAPGDSLASGSMRLVMQSDGNLVAYLKAGGTTPEWSSGTWGHPGAYAVMQTDGNLVIYGPGGGPSTGGALWSSGTWGHPGAHAVLQDDGNLVVYQPGSVWRALWASGSYGRPQTITSGEVLKSGWWTQGRRTFLVMQPDGNLVLYRRRDGAAIWSSGTWGHPGSYAVMQSDGNLVVYRPGGGPGKGGALWSSGTWGHSGAWAWMQDDGNLVVYPFSTSTWDPVGALWASNTWRTSA